jgi:uncharacterized protein (TIGR02597 family)
MTASILRISLSAALASLAASVSFAAATVPMGAMVYTVSAGPNRVTSFSVPLRDSVPVTFVGASAGVIASVAAGTGSQNIVTVTGAGWSVGQFRVASAPFFLRIMSGTSVGRTLLVPASQTTNTDSTVIVDAQGATLVGNVAPGDKFEIFQADTLASFFADLVSSGTILTGATAAVSDTVQVFTGTAWNTYFHNGTNWRLSTVPTSQDNFVIRPDAAILFTRRSGAQFSFTTLGTVPSTDLKVVVRDGGGTYLGNLFPVDRTLANQGISNMGGWVTAPTAVGADRVQIFNGTAWQSYFFDGTNWKLTVGINSNPNVPAGRPMFIQRASTASTSSVKNFTLPYNLN